MRVVVDVDLQDLVENMNHDEARKLVEKIDLAMADFEFTEGLVKYLLQQLKIECDAGAQEFNLNDYAPE